MNDQNKPEQQLNTLISYPRFRELQKTIKQCHKMPGFGEPQCMAIEGPAGTGKTTLVLNYATPFRSKKSKEEACIPILYLSTPSPVTAKDLASKMLEEMGDSAPLKGTQATLHSRLVAHIKSLHVEFIILDDFQHLIDCETQRVRVRVVEWLTALIKETQVPFLVVGIDNKVSTILNSNPQCSQLFGVREKLLPFQWDVSAPATIQEFGNIVRAAEVSMGYQLPWRSDSDIDLLYRFYYATDGVMINLMNLLRYGRKITNVQGKDELSMDILAVAFNKRLAGYLAKKVNPFDATWGENFAPPAKPASSHFINSRKKKRGMPKLDGDHQG